MPKKPIPKAHPIGSLDKKELLESYLKQRHKDPASYYITSHGASEAIASASPGAAKSSASASSIITNNSNWQSQRYQQAKLRSRQSIQAKKKQSSMSTPSKENTKLIPTSGKSNSSVVLKDIKNSPQRNKRQTLAKKNVKGLSPQEKQIQHYGKQKYAEPKKIKNERINANKSEDANSKNTEEVLINTASPSLRSHTINETNDYEKEVVRRERSNSSTMKNTIDKMNGNEGSDNQAKKENIGKENEKLKKPSTSKKSSKLNLKPATGTPSDRNIGADDLNQMSSDESFEVFMNELKRKFKADHVELFNSFYAIMHTNSKQAMTPSSLSSDSRKRKRKLSSKTETHLAFIDKKLRNKVRTNVPQVLTDKQLLREKRRKKKGITTTDGDSSPSSSTASSKGKSDSSDKKDKNRKTKLIEATTISVNNRKDNNDRNLPKVIKLQSSNEETIEDYNGNQESAKSSLTNTSIEKDKFCIHPPKDDKAGVSHSISLQRIKKSLRPPLPPSSSYDSSNNQSKKQQIPRWRAVLIEKKKERRREERLKEEAADDDDDNKSINTVDLESSVEDAVGKSKVISIFGKLVPLVSRPKPRQSLPQTTIESDDGNSSPWAIKLKPVNRKSMVGSDFNSLQLDSSTPNEKYTSTATGYTPYSPKPVQSRIDQSPSNDTVKSILNPGDVIDLNNLPTQVFNPDEKPITVPITNNNGNRNQIVILGESILIIASRFVDRTSGSGRDRANILWYTARSQIETLNLNNKADGVSISVKNGTSFPLNFESGNQCFSFMQSYFNMKQTFTQNHAVEPFTTPTRMESTSSATYDQNLVGPSATYATPLIGVDKADYDEETTRLEPNYGETAELTQNIAEEVVDMSKYRTMLKCGVPEVAIRHQMSKDGVDVKLQGTVFLQVQDNHQSEINENEHHSPPKSRSGIASFLENHLQKKQTTSYSTPTKSVQTPGSKSGVASMLERHLKSQLTYVKTKTPNRDLPNLNQEEEEIAAKYKKMLKVGMPKDAVFHAMKRDQISEKIVKAIQKAVNEQVPASNSSTWNQEEERILNRFKKMLNLNVSHEQVRNKMMLENVDKKLIEEVLGKMTPSNHEEESQGTTEPKEDNAVPEKFKRMLKMGIPREAVRHAMIKENIENKLIDSFLGTIQVTSNASLPQVTLNEDEKKEVDAYKKMMKIGLPPDAVRHKMTKENASANVISAVFGNDKAGSHDSPGTAQKRKKSDMIHFHWEKLSNDKIENTNSFWFRSAKKPKFDSHDIDMDKLKELFKKPSKDQKVTFQSSSQDQGGNKMAHILDSNRAQNVSINLQAFKQFSIDKLVDIIKDLDADNEIKGDRVQFLTGLLPKEEEMDALQKYNGEEKYLIHAELFFKKLLSVPRFQEKIKVVQTMEQFQQNFDDIFSKFNILQTTCSNVIRSEKLQLILESVLAIGNIMNQGTYSGDAQGIKFDSLLKLTQTKSKDKKMSVLDYIIRMFIDKNERYVLDLNDDFPECSKASRILITDVKTSYSSLDSTIKICKTEMNKMKNEQIANGMKFSPGFLRLEAFMAKSETALAQLKEARDKASYECKELAEYCGEDGEERNAKSLLEILTEFQRSIQDAVMKYDRQQEQEAKKEARNKKSNETKGNGTNESIDTPRRALFNTPSTHKTSKDSIEIEKTIKIQPSKHKITNEGKNQATQIATINTPPLQSTMKEEGSNTIQAIDPRKALLQSIQRRGTQEVQTTKNHDKSTRIDKSRSTGAKPKEESIDPRKSMLQAIEQRRHEKDTSDEIDTLSKIDPRKTMLQAIEQRRKEQDTSDVMHQTTAANTQRFTSETRRKAKEESKQDDNDPRKAMLQALVQRQAEKDSSVMERPFPVNSSNKLLHNILKRKVEDEGNNPTSNTRPGICFQDEENKGVNNDGERRVFRSSRSLGCGIIPDWEVAIPTYDPS